LQERRFKRAYCLIDIQVQLMNPGSDVSLVEAAQSHSRALDGLDSVGCYRETLGEFR
jgi:hypothetical protein